MYNTLADQSSCNRACTFFLEHLFDAVYSRKTYLEMKRRERKESEGEGGEEEEEWRWRGREGEV